MDKDKLKQVLLSIFNEYTQEMTSGSITSRTPWVGKAIRDERFSELADEIIVTLDIADDLKHLFDPAKPTESISGKGLKEILEGMDNRIKELEKLTRKAWSDHFSPND